MNGVPGDRWRRLARNSDKRSLMLLRQVQHSTHGDVLVGGGVLLLIRNTEDVVHKEARVGQKLKCPKVVESVEYTPSNYTWTAESFGVKYQVERIYGECRTQKVITKFDEYENISEHKWVLEEVDDKQAKEWVDRPVFTVSKWNTYKIGQIQIREAVEWCLSVHAAVWVDYEDRRVNGGTLDGKGSESFGATHNYYYAKNDDGSFYLVRKEESGKISLNYDIPNIVVTTEDYEWVEEVNINDADFPKGKDVPKVRM